MIRWSSDELLAMSWFEDQQSGVRVKILAKTYVKTFSHHNL